MGNLVRLFTLPIVVIALVVIITVTENNTNVLGVHSDRSVGVEQNFVRMAGGIVPHHLVAGELIDDFFRRIAIQNPRTIILLGPNHNEAGEKHVLTSTKAWDTSYGLLKPDYVTIEDLVGQGVLSVNDAVLHDEHSISTITPFLKRYLPDTTIVPIILSAEMSLDDSIELSNVLVSELNEDTVIVASVDLSHYLKHNEAIENDKITIQSIKDYNYRVLTDLGSDYLDSTASIITLLKTMELGGYTNNELLHHTTSAEILNDYFVDTTSYITMSFY